ncbi:hypothetical protein [Nonomuraea wenchangensis]|uniref:Uncharacterized protein n=1 Tax=Nonomuraea wenchangensis TaxID=568860 RepID=A0A1I0HDS7_9ACTN|nr:hypothetical protein [Nonomuraea wenchangensis]SET81049.1 hypothetical protein SAMN05421811_104223 [Nonomuraea wenchangensis]
MTVTTAIDDFFDRELVRENFGVSASFLRMEEELRNTREAEELKTRTPDERKPFGYAFDLDGTIDIDAVTQYEVMAVDPATHRYDPEAQIWSTSHDSTQIHSALTFCFRGTCGYYWGFDNNIDDGY